MDKTIQTKKTNMERQMLFNSKRAIEQVLLPYVARNHGHPSGICLTTVYHNIAFNRKNVTFFLKK